MTMVCGGMLLPLVGLLADHVGIINSYVLLLGLFLYLFVYAVALSRPRPNLTSTRQQSKRERKGENRT